MKLDQDDVTRICTRVVDHDVSTKIVAAQFDVTRRRVQQLAKQYRDTGDVPQLDTPGRNPYADHPDDLADRVLAIHDRLGVGAVAVAHVLRVRDDLSIATNTVHDILKANDTVTENPAKQGRRRPWVRFEREHSLVTVHMDWYRNDRDQWVLAVEDDASRYVFALAETDARSAARSVAVLDAVREQYETTVPILEVITDHGGAFVAPHQEERPDCDHDFEGYLAKHDIRHSLCKVGRPQSNGKVERFFQTYEKQRWRFDDVEAFLAFYNEERPHMSLDWDSLETPTEAFERLRPDPAADFDDEALLATAVSIHE